MGCTVYTLVQAFTPDTFDKPWTPQRTLKKGYQLFCDSGASKKFSLSLSVPLFIFRTCLCSSSLPPSPAVEFSSSTCRSPFLPKIDHIQLIFHQECVGWVLFFWGWMCYFVTLTQCVKSLWLFRNCVWFWSSPVKQNLWHIDGKSNIESILQLRCTLYSHMLS